jgi:hypothetical protein
LMPLGRDGLTSSHLVKQTVDTGSPSRSQGGVLWCLWGSSRMEPQHYISASGLGLLLRWHMIVTTSHRSSSSSSHQYYCLTLSRVLLTPRCPEGIP